MATILLQAAGAAAGGLFGTAGAAVGSAAGAIAGYLIDQAWMGGARHVHGPRLAGPRPLAAEEGQPVPRLYGMARLGATLIWATRFEEESRTERQGGKGGTRLTSYSYYANVALALCEGDIAGVRRIWADGVELDREQVELRVYRGTADQLADPLIESRQGQAMPRPIAASPMRCWNAFRSKLTAIASRSSSSRCCGRWATSTGASAPSP